MKRLAAKVGEFVNQNQETKGEYVKLGVIGSSQNGEYLLLDPTVNLAGILQKQNMFAHSKGKKTSSSVMVSVFDNSQQGNGQQAGYQNQQSSQQNRQQMQEPDFDYDDSIPF